MGAARRGRCRDPRLPLIRRLAQVPPSEQFTTAITLGELLYGAERRGSDRLRARLEAEGRRLDEPDLRIASLALARDLALVTANVRHFDRVPGLTLENWLA